MARTNDPQLAPNWPDPGHGTAQEAHLHSQALQFPDLTMNSSFFKKKIRVIHSQWGELPHSSDSKWEILHCHVGGVHQIYAQRTYSHTPSERGLKLAIPGVPHPSCCAPKPQGPCSGRHGGRWNLSDGTSWWLGIQVLSIILFHKPIPLRFPQVVGFPIYIKDADPEGCWLDQLKVQNHGQGWGYMVSIGASHPLFFGLQMTDASGWNKKIPPTLSSDPRGCPIILQSMFTQWRLNVPFFCRGGWSHHLLTSIEWHRRNIGLIWFRYV